MTPTGRSVIERDGVDPADVTVVRTGPDLTRLQRTAPVPSLRRSARYMAAYLGVMGPQDGVDLVVRMADHVVNRLERRDISFTLIGSGDCFDDLVALSERLGLSEFVTFTGRVPDADVSAVLSTADVGISPDPKNPLNDLSTMNKTMEYMTFALPVVAFDLRETRVSAGDAAVYATPNDVTELAQLLVDLVDDEPRRHSMGEAGRDRIEQELAWKHQSPRYVGVYEQLMASARRRVPTISWRLTMCGIAGAYQQVDGAAVTTTMGRCLNHRGPDEEGSFSHTDGRVDVHLAHRRLSIIDLQHGQQPLVKRPFALCYNGELYNYREIRAELIAGGARFDDDL